MSIAVVTDSGCDLPPGIAEKLGIKIVHLYLVFGNRILRNDEISPDEFYRMLSKSRVQPTTTQPPPEDFLKVCESLIKEGVEEIVLILLSRKLSRTFQSACSAVKRIIQEGTECRFKIIDSRGVGMWQGFLAMLAARLAQQGKGLTEIAKEVRENISRLHLMAILDTLDYADLGGRLGKAKSLVAQVATSALPLKGVLTLKEGEASRAGSGLVLSPLKINYLAKFVKSFHRIKEIAIEHSMLDERELRRLIDKINELFRERKETVSILVTKIGPVLGAHTGPGTLAVIVREE